jgi:hypothetical protein
MDPNWNELQQQMEEAFGWNFQAAFDPNMILIAPLFTPPEEPVPEDPDSIE